MEVKIRIDELNDEDIRCITEDILFTIDDGEITDFRYDDLDDPNDISELLKKCTSSMKETILSHLNENLDRTIAERVWDNMRQKLHGKELLDYRNIDIVLSMLDKEDLEKTKELYLKQTNINNYFYAR